MTGPNTTPTSGRLSRRAALTVGGSTLLTGAFGLITAPAASAQDPEYWFPKLRIGDSNPVLVNAQTWMRELRYYYGSFHARFTLEVQAAVMKHQRTYGLDTDGVLGPRTWTSLMAVRRTKFSGYEKLRRGSEGMAVSTLQSCLSARQRRDLRNDRKFGPATEARVKEYQRSCGLVADGVVGPATWAALRAGR